MSYNITPKKNGRDTKRTESRDALAQRTKVVEELALAAGLAFALYTSTRFAARYDK